METMLEQVLETILRFGMISPGQRVSVACSGGPDSTARAWILLEMSPHLGCTLSLCHFNHRLRGEESDGDEQFVRRLAERLQVPFYLECADVGRAARSAGANLEGKAREMRYGFLFSLAESGKTDRVAVGHTADDQAETVLHRLLRGAGTRGLAGAYPVVEGKIIRPLFEVRRSALLDWLKTQQKPWREDASNQDLRYTRNRIRRQLLPLLSQFNPRIVETLAANAAIARDEEAFWQDYLKPILLQSTRWIEGKLQIDIEQIREAPPAVARRVLRWATGAVAQKGHRSSKSDSAEASLRKWSKTLPLDSVQIEQLLRFACTGQSGGVLSLPLKMAARKEFSHLFIECANNECSNHERANSQCTNGERADSPNPMPQKFSRQIRIPSQFEVPEINALFAFKLVPWATNEARYNKEGGGLLDSGIAENPLTLRSWQPGDSYRQKGHRGRRKLKELFQRFRISRSERQGWPVLLCGNEIVWTRGLEVAEGFSPRRQSRQAILIQESKL